jgi:hypothetical protein
MSMQTWLNLRFVSPDAKLRLVREEDTELVLFLSSSKTKMRKNALTMPRWFEG